MYGTDPNDSRYFVNNDEGIISTVTESTIFSITSEDKAVMLNNAHIESNNGSDSIEAVKISLLPDDDNVIIWLSPTIKLNGVAIDCSGDGLDGYGAHTGTIKYKNPSITDDLYKFIYYIDLTCIKTINGEYIQDTNGYYEISIEYHYKYASGQTTSSQNVINFGIYICIYWCYTLISK